MRAVSLQRRHAGHPVATHALASGGLGRIAAHPYPENAHSRQRRIPTRLPHCAVQEHLVHDHANPGPGHGRDPGRPGQLQSLVGGSHGDGTPEAMVSPSGVSSIEGGAARTRSSTPRDSQGSGSSACSCRARVDLPALEPPLSRMTRIATQEAYRLWMAMHIYHSPGRAAAICLSAIWPMSRRPGSPFETMCVASTRTDEGAIEVRESGRAQRLPVHGFATVRPGRSDKTGVSLPELHQHVERSSAALPVQVLAEHINAAVVGLDA